ncbi:ras-like GTP-binding protein rhoA isoform X2 [Nematostella vectensis]|uniref:ras-like GTP-binding protein rhoA isoform X2 n=1 Tax=Nematostella vectensis TaxID=45351 RepID=UPI0013903733|nr:ras-like GTP-binding protein rhoA isoform X2 [Nematostella vectensis]
MNGRTMKKIRQRSASQPNVSIQHQHINKMLLKASINVVPEQSDTHATSERYKLSVVGDAESGKTSLLNALVKSDIEVEETVIFEECVTDVTSGDSNLEFMLWDSSGLENYESIRRQMYLDTDVFLVCFDIGNPSSLQSVIDKWAPELKEACPGVPYLLIGCKNDLRTDSALELNFLSVPGEPDNADSISRLRAIATAQSIGARQYVECCAKMRWNIKEVFQQAAEAILSKEDSNNTEAPKPQSMLRRFSRFARRSSAADVMDMNSSPLPVPTGCRRLSLFTTG